MIALALAVENSTGLMSHIADVKNIWTLSAFAIAAILSAYNVAVKRRGNRQGLWIIVVAILILAIVPMLIQTGPPSIYRVRVTTLDLLGAPIEQVTVKTTTTNAASTAQDGSCELTIPRGTLNQEGKITIFADKPPLHGQAELTLASDANPSIVIRLQKPPSEPVSGQVQDEKGKAIAGARVSIPGGKAVDTNQDGNFTLETEASPGEQVAIHAEKPGYAAVTQTHPVGAGPATVVLRRSPAAHKR